MVVGKAKVVEVARLTVRWGEVVIGSSGVLLELSVDRRDCSQKVDGDYRYVLLRASVITFFLPSVCSMVMSS